MDDSINDNVFQVFLDDGDHYLFADLPLASVTERNSWSWRARSHIDHIMITDELFDIFARPASSIHTLRLDHYLADGMGEYNTQLSDHCPVGIKLDLAR